MATSNDQNLDLDGMYFVNSRVFLIPLESASLSYLNNGNAADLHIGNQNEFFKFFLHMFECLVWCVLVSEVLIT